jgi:pentatricopeptide repeat protein
MDYLRVLLVPFHASSLLLIAAFTILLTFFGTYAGYYGILIQLFLSIWLFKYCYFVVEQLADGAQEPPVMDTDMLSPFEVRPWIQAALIGACFWSCMWLGRPLGTVLAIVLLFLLPASIAILGAGDSYWHAAQPYKLWLVVWGLGPYYGLILAVIAFHLLVAMLIDRSNAPQMLSIAYSQFAVISVFGVIGASMFERRKQLGLQPSRSPERAAARAEAERVKLRAKMLDDVFQLARLGKHVDATKPLAAWLRDVDTDIAVRDGVYVAEQAARWDHTGSLNTIGSTLIRHLLRAGRPDAALSVFELLRARHPQLMLDSAPDLRLLIDYAETQGKADLVSALRLETRVFRPDA